MVTYIPGRVQLGKFLARAPGGTWWHFPSVERSLDARAALELCTTTFLMQEGSGHMGPYGAMRSGFRGRGVDGKKRRDFYMGHR